MHHPRLSGSYYEMGFKYGSILKRVGYQMPRISEEMRRFAKGCEAEVKRVFPEILEELQGFADGCEISYEDLKAFFLSLDSGEHEHESCSIFASSSPQPILGRNHDFYYAYKKYAQTCLTMPRDAYWSLGNSTIFIGKEDGINEAGVAIGVSVTRIKEIRPGVNWFIAVRAVLDKCSNVSEAKKFLSNIKFSTGNNYLLIDESGDMAVVEASPQRVRVREKFEGDFLIATNHFIHPDMRDIENIEERPPTSMMRYERIKEIIKLNDGKVDVELAKKILSDHKGSICSHVKAIKLGTLWSFIALPKEREALIAEGHPCKAHYKEDKRLKQALMKRGRLQAPGGIRTRGQQLTRLPL